MLISTTVSLSLYWPLQRPGTLCTIKTSQLQLLATSPPPPPPLLHCSSPLPLCSPLKQKDKSKPPMTSYNLWPHYSPKWKHYRWKKGRDITFGANQNSLCVSLQARVVYVN